jgi:membrane fusion protein (multidrug efflux system)
MKTCAPAFVFLLGVAAATIVGCGNESGKTPVPSLPVARVQTLVVDQSQRPETEEVVGTVRAKLHASIEAKVSGRVERMLGAPGQTVKAGDLLVQIDAREIQARLDQAIAVRDQASLELERLGKLLEQRAVSRQEYDNIQARQRVAVATMIEAETMLDYTKVTAPFGGTITRKYADVGDLAAPGKPLLDMEDSQALRFEADVPEALIGYLHQGESLRVRVSSATNDLPAVVSEIAPAAETASRTFLVKLDLPAGTGIRAGQFGRVTVSFGQSPSLRVPAEAVVRRGQMEIVFVVKDGRAGLRLVKSGRRLGNELELVSGMDSGEKIVIRGAAALRDGQQVLEANHEK